MTSHSHFSNNSLDELLSVVNPIKLQHLIGEIKGCGCVYPFSFDRFNKFSIILFTEVHEHLLKPNNDHMTTLHHNDIIIL